MLRTRGSRTSTAALVVVLLFVCAVWIFLGSGGGDGSAAASGRYDDSDAAHYQQQQLLQSAEVDVRPGARPGRLHGLVGLDEIGTPLWVPQSVPARGSQTQAEALKAQGFNLRLSDSLSLDRDVPDNRHRLCRTQLSSSHLDLSTLPRTTVVFVFHNEALSTLLRSVHSVLNRSPPALLGEIILVDDGSTLSDLGPRLDRYVAALPKVRLHRHGERLGLVRGRLTGIGLARTTTATVLDSHIEVQEGWLEPLMARLAHNPTHVVFPQIDSIDQMTFRPEAGGIGCTLGFLWQLVEHAIPTQRKDAARLRTAIDPVPSPTHAGGLFALNREYFHSIGGYDTEFGFWGAENLEFSFRIWQCGGVLECVPCSRVYHVFRKGGKPYTSPGDHATKNKMRTAALWMDEFAVIPRAANGYPKIDIGPLTAMRKLRRDLKCHSFQWFLDNVYPESPIRSLDAIRSLGQMRNPATNRCFDTMQTHDKVGTFGCHGQGGSQAWMLLADHERPELYRIQPLSDLESCLVDINGGLLGQRPCERIRKQDGLFRIEETFNVGGADDGKIVEIRAVSGSTCITAVNGGEEGLAMRPCTQDSAANSQAWQLTPLDVEAERKRAARELAE